MYALKFAVNQMLPSLSAARPCGPEPSVFSGYSLISPVFGSSLPSLFANWPVYHSAPSAATAGSCGREFGVGTSYSRMVTLRSLVIGRDAQKMSKGTREKRRILFSMTDNLLLPIINPSLVEKL